MEVVVPSSVPGTPHASSTFTDLGECTGGPYDRFDNELNTERRLAAVATEHGRVRWDTQLVRG